MNLRRLSIFVAIFAVISSPLPAFANNGSTAADFLNIGVSARGGATGGALSALSDGAIAPYYNPAGLSGIGGIQIAGMHTEWLQDLRYEYLGMAFPAGSVGSFGVIMSYLGIGDMQGYSSSNIPLGKFSAYDYMFGLSYGRQISSAFSLGAGIKGIGEKLDNVSASGFAGDFGAQYRTGNIGAGLSVMNIGPKMKYATASSSLPTRADAAISYAPWGSNLNLLVGLTIPFQGNAGFKTGLEYTYADLLTLRTGYNTENRGNSESGMSFGAGFNIFNNSLDYAYNVNSLLGGTHQISFVLRFGQSGGPDGYSDFKDSKSSQEGGAKRSEDVNKRSDKVTYLVCAGKYSDRTSAEKHIDALGKFGCSSKLNICGQNEFRVVLGKAGGQSRAEKMLKNFEKKGLSCFIEEE
jgi:hypothetical protein